MHPCFCLLCHIALILSAYLFAWDERKWTVSFVKLEQARVDKLLPNRYRNDHLDPACASCSNELFCSYRSPIAWHLWMTLETSVRVLQFVVTLLPTSSRAIMTPTSTIRSVCVFSSDAWLGVWCVPSVALVSWLFMWCYEERNRSETLGVFTTQVG